MVCSCLPEEFPAFVGGVVGRDQGWLEPSSEGMRGVCCLLVLHGCGREDHRLMLAFIYSWFCGNSVHPAAASIPVHRVRSLGSTAAGPRDGDEDDHRSAPQLLSFLSAYRAIEGVVGRLFAKDVGRLLLP